MPKKYTLILLCSLSMHFLMSVSFACNTEKKGLFHSEQIKKFFAKDGGDLGKSQDQFTAMPLVIAEPAEAIPPHPLESLLLSLQDDKEEKIYFFDPYLFIAINYQVAIPRRIRAGKALLKQPLKTLINPGLNLVDAYKQGHEEGSSHTMFLVNRYAEIILKDELPALQKKIYDEAKLEVQSMYNDEKSKMIIAHNVVIQGESKKNLKKGLFVGIMAGGFIASTLVYYHHQYNNKF